MSDIYTITLSDGTTTFTVYPLESNGPGNVSIPRQVQVANVGASFELVGDLTYRFVPGFTFTVENSGSGSPVVGNNGTYTVAVGDSSYSSGSNRTTIPVDEGFQITISGAQLGQIKYSIPSAEEATSILIPGRGYINYGHAMVESSVHMLENFAHTSAPANPLTGQLWFNTTDNTLNKWTGAAWSANTALGNAALIFNDPENPNAVGSPAALADVTMSGSDTTYPDVGVALRNLIDPTAADSIFRVLSATGSERLRVEHDGHVATTNSFKQTGTSVVNEFSNDLQFANAKGVTAIGGADLRTDATGVTWELKGNNVAAATLIVKDVAGTSNLLTVDVNDNVQILNNLIVDTDTLYVDAANNTVGIGIVPVTGTRLTLPQENDAVTPTFAFGDGDTGFYESADDTLSISVAGAPKFHFQSNALISDTANGAFLRNNNTTSTVPTLGPNRGDQDTGIGSNTADELSLIAGAVEGIRITTTGVTVSHPVNMSTNKITNVVDPADPQDAATKQYVDSSTAAPDYDLQVGTGDGGSPLTTVNYTTSFTFTVPAGSPAITATVMVFVNGIKQVEGATKAYTLTAPTTVTFNVGQAPATNDDVEFYDFG